MSERSLRRAAARRAAAAARREARLSGRAGRAAAVALGAGAIFAPGASAATFEVTSLADGAADACDASCTLRDALTAANADAAADTITFASGLSGRITLTQGAIPVTAATTITGPGADVLAVDGNNADRIMEIDSSVGGASGDPVTISGLTFADGNTAGSGGAIVAGGDTILTIADSVFTGNDAGDDGGAVAARNAGLTVSGSRFSGNTADEYAGAVYASYFETTQPFTVSDSVITGNTAADYGGGIAVYDQDGPAVIERTTISGNTATGQDGGGIWFEDAYNGQPITIRDSTITGNTAPAGDGGGISFGENFDGPTQIVNSTVVGNSADRAGGVQFNDISDISTGFFALRNSTVTGNSATTEGGGLLRGDGGNDAELRISSSVVSGNTAPSGADVLSTPGVVGDLTIGNSLIGDVTGETIVQSPPGTVLTGVDPLLGPLADNGGPTQTRRPLDGSPLLDAGLAGGLTGDQRGAPRVQDLPDVAQTLGSDGTDIGAMEVTLNAAPALAVPGPQSVVAGQAIFFGSAAGNPIAVDDPEGLPVTVTLTASTGTLSLPGAIGLTFTQGDGTADPVLAFSGALADVQTALEGLRYDAPAGAGGTTATLGVTLQDSRPPGGTEPITVTGSVAIAITAAPVPVPGASTPVAPAPCPGTSVTIRPQLSGPQVVITGAALRRYAGQDVAIVSGGNVLRTLKAAADGTFRTTLTAPGRATRSTITYQAVLADTRSTAYRLERETVITRVDGRTVTGRIKGYGKGRSPRSGILYLDASCAERRRAATVRINSRGRFTFRLPQGSGDFSVYRLRVRLNSSAVSWTAPLFTVNP